MQKKRFTSNTTFSNKLEKKANFCMKFCLEDSTSTPLHAESSPKVKFTGVVYCQVKKRNL